MKEREKNYQSLRRMYNSKNAEISEIKAEIKKLNLVIEDKENLINNLNMKITGLVSTAKRLDSRISELTDENKNKRDSIDMVTNRLNTPTI
jgi:chromosome segregation ATPase